MWLLEIFRLRLRSLFGRARMESDLDDEVRLHIEAETENLIATTGMSVQEARAEAQRRFGHLLTIKDECRDARAVRLWDELFQDCRYGVRSLCSTPLLSAIAVVTLALGIGANTAVFSVVYAVVLRPLPYPDPDRLVWVTQYFPRFDSRLVTGNDFLAWEQRSSSFASLAAWSAGPFAVDSGEAPEQLRGALVSGGYFAALGVEPLAGRLFTAEEGAPGGDRVALIGETLWRERFGASNSVIGNTLRINDEPHTIVGVLPGCAEHIEPAALWIPLRLTPAGPGQPIQLVRALGRLHSGVKPDSAQAELQLLARRAQQELYGGASDSTTEVISLHERLVGNVRRSLFPLWAAVGLVLLLACANVASLLLARLSRRTKEVSLKLSLGARRLRLVRQFLVEATLLAVAGASAGLLIANGGTSWLLRLFPQGVPRAETVSLDVATLSFTLGVAVLAAIVFGTLPAMRGTKANLSELLKSSARTAAGAAGVMRLQNALVICQFALATVIAFNAALLARTFLNVRGVDPGFAAGNVLTAQIDLSRTRDSVARRVFWERLLERLSAVPGLARAALADGLPLSSLGGTVAFFSVEGRPVWEPDDAPAHRTRVYSVSENFFAVLSIPVVAGRVFDSREASSDPPAVVINEALAERAFAGHSPLGSRLKLGVPEGPGPWLTVVGVVRNMKQEGLDEDDQPMIYRPYQQSPNLAVGAIMLQTGQDPAAMVSALRHEIRQLDPAQPIHDVATMRQRLARTTAPQRERAVLVAAFAVLALALAGAGVFGVLSHLVARQASEMGLRMALGARASDLLRLVLKRGLLPAVLGVGIGMAATASLSRFVEGLLFGVGAADLAATVTTVLVLFAVAGLACYWPARRASKLDPVSALRIE